MFQWYQNAEICYVYLSDVHLSDHDASQTQDDFEKECSRSQWFTRGWTLQELLAPRYVEFFDQSWTEIGTKVSLAEPLERITGITHLFHFREASVAQKLS